MVPLSNRLRLKFDIPQRSPTTPDEHAHQVWPLPLSLATTYGITTCFLFLRLLRCFSSAGLRLYHAVFNCIGCPIRTPADQTVVCTSPQFFAAYHVLRRLREPRHPPYALISLPSLNPKVLYPDPTSLLFFIRKTPFISSIPSTLVTSLSTVRIILLSQSCQ